MQLGKTGIHSKVMLKEHFGNRARKGVKGRVYFLVREGRRVKLRGLALYRYRQRRFCHSKRQQRLGNPHIQQRITEHFPMPRIRRIGQVGGSEYRSIEMLRRALDGFFMRQPRTDAERGRWIGYDLFHGVFPHFINEFATDSLLNGGWRLHVG